jgi:hypothetical protein
MMTRRDYVDFVESSYFGSMAAGRPERCLEFFAEGAVLTARFPGSPVRVVRKQPRLGEETLTHFFCAVLEKFRVSYSDFWHSVDVEAQRVTSLYTLHIAPRAADAPAELTRQIRNGNFFQFEDGKLTRVLVTGVASDGAAGLG